MNRPSGKLLARPRLPQDQDRARAGGDSRKHIEDPLHERAVAGHVADPKFSVQFLPQGFHLAQIAERFRAAGHAARPIAENGRRNADRNAPAVGLDDEAGAADDRLSRLHRPPQGAISLAHAGTKDVGAEAPESLFPGNSGNLLGRAVERSDPPIPVHREYAVGNAFENGVCRRNGRLRQPALPRGDFSRSPCFRLGHVSTIGD